MNGFALTVAAVDRIDFQGTALSCTVRTTTGWRTFEAHHEPFAAVIAGDLFIVDGSGARHRVPVGDGLLRFTGPACVITVADGVHLDKS